MITATWKDVTPPANTTPHINNSVAKLLGNGAVIAEVKPHMKGTFKVMYADKPDLGPSNYGYDSIDTAKAAAEKRFGISLS